MEAEVNLVWHPKYGVKESQVVGVAGCVERRDLVQRRYRYPEWTCMVCTWEGKLGEGSGCMCGWCCGQMLSAMGKQLQQNWSHCLLAQAANACVHSTKDTWGVSAAQGGPCSARRQAVSVPGVWPAPCTAAAAVPESREGCFTQSGRPCHAVLCQFSLTHDCIMLTDHVQSSSSAAWTLSLCPLSHTHIPTTPTHSKD